LGALFNLFSFFNKPSLITFKEIDGEVALHG
jgi:hypothetical protein